MTINLKRLETACVSNNYFGYCAQYKTNGKGKFVMGSFEYIVRGTEMWSHKLNAHSEQ